MSLARALLIVAILTATTTFAATRTAPAPRPSALDALPLTVAAWHGAATAPFDAETERELGADVYITRAYAATAATPIDLYIAYYAQQRPNVSIHSPLHCLPGTGWEPLEVSTIDLGSSAGTTRVRRMLVRKNLDRAVVLYWYAIQGRVVADEIASRFILLRDSVIAGRSDAALVRISAAVTASTSTAGADRDVMAFARALLPSVTF